MKEYKDPVIKSVEKIAAESYARGYEDALNKAANLLKILAQQQETANANRRTERSEN